MFLLIFRFSLFATLDDKTVIEHPVSGVPDSLNECLFCVSHMSSCGDFALYTYSLCVMLLAVTLISSSAIWAAQSEDSSVLVTNLAFSLGLPPKQFLLDVLSSCICYKLWIGGVYILLSCVYGLHT